MYGGGGVRAFGFYAADAAHLYHYLKNPTHKSREPRPKAPQLSVPKDSRANKR